MWLIESCEETPPIFSVNEIGELTAYLKAQSGDGQGLELLATHSVDVIVSDQRMPGMTGLELQDRFESLDTVDLVTGRTVTLNAAQCKFAYRDSIFKQALAGKSLIVRVRLRLPKPWQPMLGYLDLERKMEETGNHQPDARTLFDWVCSIRRAKLPDPAQIGNVGSFFKNPVVTPEQCRDIIARDPHVVHYPLEDGRFKLAAGWLIDACGWKGKTVGNAAVYEKQALVLVNYGDATGNELLEHAKRVRQSVLEKFGVELEMEVNIVGG